MPGGIAVTRPLVALDALLLRPHPTGVGRSILDLTAALAVEDRGFDVAVLCTHPEMLAHLQDAAGWRLVPCPGARGGTLRKAAWTQLRLPGLLRRLGVDLLHCLQFVAPLRAPCPLVVTVHDLGYLRFPGTVEQPRRAYYGSLVPRSLRAARAVVCNSTATAADVVARFPDVAGRVSATPFGLPSWVEGRTPAPPERTDEAPFLFVGTLEPRKNLEGLALAYRDFVTERDRQGRSAPRLVLVGGRGWSDSGLRSVLAPLIDAGRVELADYCGPDDLWRWYGVARALLFPSLHEGFGFPILEAMAADLPVLTSDRGAMAEVAGNAALLVDPTSRADLVSALHRLADDRALGLTLVEGGRERLKVFRWSETARLTAETYHRVLADAAAGSARR
jgi:glycosyltransferase involved in cell wall biosynthesis